MRAYTPKNDVQQKSYYNDRFYVTPTLEKQSVYNDSTLSSDYIGFNNAFTVNDAYIELDHLVLIINPEDNVNAIEYLKTYRGYDMMMELTAVDYVASKGGFEIVYELLSTTKRRRIRVKAFINNGDAINSVEGIFRMANFSEREMFDMYGIYVNNHSYLKRILMPDDWQGHPLLKTYPLQGDEAASWYEVDKIFGKDARDVIGPELRDAACVDRYDTERFARLGHEVPFGAEISEGNEPDTPIQYQEEGGVKLFGATLVTPFDKLEKTQLKERK